MFDVRQVEYNINKKGKVLLSTFTEQDFIDITILDDNDNVEGSICLFKSDFYEIYRVLEDEKDYNTDIGNICIEGNFLQLCPWTSNIDD